MVTVEDAVIARLKTHGQNFEILVDCNNALAVRENKNVDMKNVLAAMRIFTDAKKGLEASESGMKQIFQTTDVEEVAKQIIKKGEIQLTSEYRNSLRENKRKQIINLMTALPSFLTFFAPEICAGGVPINAPCSKT